MNPNDPAHLETSTTEETLIELDSQMARAVVAGDLATLERLLCGTYAFIIPEGHTVTREQYFDDIRSGRWTPSSVHNEDVQARVYGGRAGVVTGTATYRWLDWRGQTLQATERYTSTWVLEDAGWCCVASSATSPGVAVHYRTQAEHAHVKNERLAVRAAILDYVESVQEAPPALPERRVGPDLAESSFGPDQATASATVFKEWQASMSSPDIGDTHREVMVYDVQGRIASGRLKEGWGVAHLHLVKNGGGDEEGEGWKVVNIAWQGIRALR
ncbi:nuclear transport factor 2 family protein [Deinococcus sp.]|uniref:nuclear transport factor 2 family protein n=1 Tax=Deinococcus sp. TaxID=47478 RepID=UPI003C79D8A7